MSLRNRDSFTLIELLIVIAIIAVLATVVVLVLNPAQLLAQSRDSNRLSDMHTLTSALSVYEGQGGGSLGTTDTVYVSIPDPSATSTLGDQCQGLGLPTLPAGYAYHCAATSTYKLANGEGWVPVDFTSLATGSPLGTLPVDPVNTSSSRLYYTYDTNGTQYEVTMVPESSKYQLGGSNDLIGPDGGTLASVYEQGTKLGLEPLDYGDASLVGYWPLDEGTGTIAYDYSGNNATGTWNGTQAGTNGYYAAGHNQTYAGYFDGSTDYVGNISRPTASTFTYLAWVDLSSCSDYPMIISFGTGGPELRFYGSTCRPDFLFNSSQEAISPVAVTPGSWHMIAGVYDGTKGYIFVDGAQKASVVGAASLSSTFDIGRRVLTGSNPLGGLIDGVRIYSRALTASEIAVLYNGGK